MKDKFPVTIIKSNDSERPFKVATLLDKVIDTSKNIRQDLTFWEFDYATLINTILYMKRLIQESKEKDPRMYWRLGDEIITFFERLESCGFYLANQDKTLARDTGFPLSSIKKIIAFRRRFSNLSLVDPTISWAKYRDNKVLSTLENRGNGV